MQTESEEFHVFEATITKTGEKVWQYFYNDKNGNNQHSEYFKTKDEAIAAYDKKYGLSQVVYVEVDASTPPENNSRYYTMLHNGAKSENYYSTKNGWKPNSPFEGAIKSWLKPVDLSTLLQEAASNGWDAAESRMIYEGEEQKDRYYGEGQMPIPLTKEQYLKSKE